MIKDDAYKIIEKRMGAECLRFIKGSLAFHHGVPTNKCDAILMPELIIAQKPIMRRSAKDQAFILAHEWIHAKEHHHRLRIKLMHRKAVRHIPEKYQTLFIAYALDLWTNLEAKRKLGYAPRNAVMPENWRFGNRLRLAHIEWLANDLWDDKTERNRIIRHCKNVYPGLIQSGKMNSLKKNTPKRKGSHGDDQGSPSEGKPSKGASAKRTH